MRNFVQPGDSIAAAVPYGAGVTSGQGMLVGALFGVAAVDGAQNAVIEAATEEVFDLTKEPALAIAAGARLFWDDSNRRVTTTPGSNGQIGAAVTAALAGDATVRVLLDGDGVFAGTVVVARVLPLVPAANASTDLTIALPASRILAIHQRTTTAFTGTTVTLKIGTTAGGEEIVAEADIKAKAARVLTLAGSDNITPFAGGTVTARIVQAGVSATAVGAGELIFTIVPSA